MLLAIDDFGTGYSSFASLKHLTVDCLKIDKYFIDDLLIDTKTQLLVSSMIKMAHNLGCKVVAEGIEKPEQANKLKKNLDAIWLKVTSSVNLPALQSFQYY